MLHRLKISNIALIKELEIEFTNGLNVLSGETGAGKSIIIDSINFLLGDRADKTLIRRGETLAKVEGIFFDYNKEVCSILDKYGITAEDSLIISRTMSHENRSDIRINGTMVTLSVLKEVTGYLVDICSQNENQFLLKSRNQLEMLDSFCGNEKLLDSYNKELNVYNSIINELKQFGLSENERSKEIDFLEFQINEIEEAKLMVGEEDEISSELKKMSGAEKIKKYILDSNEYFDNNQGILNSLSSVIKNITDATRYDKDFEGLLKRLESVRYELADIDYELKDMVKNYDFDDSRYYELDSRLNKKTSKKIRQNNRGYSFI